MKEARQLTLEFETPKAKVKYEINMRYVVKAPHLRIYRDWSQDTDQVREKLGIADSLEDAMRLIKEFLEKNTERQVDPRGTECPRPTWRTHGWLTPLQRKVAIPSLPQLDADSPNSWYVSTKHNNPKSRKEYGTSGKYLSFDIREVIELAPGFEVMAERVELYDNHTTHIMTVTSGEDIEVDRCPTSQMRVWKKKPITIYENLYRRGHYRPFETANETPVMDLRNQNSSKERK